MNIKILSSAHEDLKIGRNFYEQQSPELGDYFFDSIFSDIDSLILYAGIHQKYHGYFRKLSNVFPYAIYYRIKDSTVIIWRVLDCRQEPFKIINKLISQ